MLIAFYFYVFLFLLLIDCCKCMKFIGKAGGKGYIKKEGYLSQTANLY